jgi:hypothetical protein
VNTSHDGPPRLVGKPRGVFASDFRTTSKFRTSSPSFNPLAEQVDCIQVIILSDENVGLFSLESDVFMSQSAQSWIS